MMGSGATSGLLQRIVEQIETHPLCIAGRATRVRGREGGRGEGGREVVEGGRRGRGSEGGGSGREGEGGREGGGERGRGGGTGGGKERENEGETQREGTTWQVLILASSMMVDNFKIIPTKLAKKIAKIGTHQQWIIYTLSHDL